MCRIVAFSQKLRSTSSAITSQRQSANAPGKTSAISPWLGSEPPTSSYCVSGLRLVESVDTLTPHCTTLRVRYVAGCVIRVPGRHDIYRCVYIHLSVEKFPPFSALLVRGKANIGCFCAAFAASAGFCCIAMSCESSGFHLRPVFLGSG